MSKLSFKNFRGFIDFPEIEIGGVTFLVGKNNAGKSSAIKAKQLILEYLNSNNLFALNLEMFDIFDNLKNRDSKDDFIKIKYVEDEYIFELTIYKRTYDLIHNCFTLKIEDIQNKFTFKLNNAIEGDYFSPSIQFQSEKYTINGRLNFGFNHRTCLYIRCSMSGIMSYIQRGLLNIYSLSSERKNFDLEISDIELINYSKSIEYITKDRDGKDLDENSIEDDMMIIKRIIKSTDKFIRFSNSAYAQFELIKSQIVTKSNILDGNDEGIGTIVSYFYENRIDRQLITGNLPFLIHDESGNPMLSKEINEKERIKAFVLKWMSNDCFNLGDDIEIEKVGKDSYSVFIIKDNQRIPLSEMGLGAIRIIYTLFSLAIVLSLSNPGFGNRKKWLFVFEEPELNLHPAWQSKLADLFYEVHTLSKGKIQIIVETHSEYIIRRSQVLVAENKLESQPNQNPFKIYYFNDEGDKKHYQIKYDEDGFLMNGFGPGFFDEASSNTLELMRLKKVKLN